MGVLRYVVHLVAGTIVATLLALLAGHLFSALLKEPLLPTAALVGALLGFYVNRRTKDRSASFVWIIPLIFLSRAVAIEAHSFSPAWSSQSLGTYLWANFASMSCGETECLYELFFTAPFLSGLAYSLGAAFSRVSHPFQRD